MKLQGFNSDLFKVSSEETSLITGGYGCTTKLESKGSTCVLLYKNVIHFKTFSYNFHSIIWLELKTSYSTKIKEMQSLE